jgi:magnesium transporter
MTVNCFQILEGSQLNRCGYDFAIEAIVKQKARIWIDLIDADTSEVENKLDDFKVHGLIRQFCLESRDHPGFFPLKELALMVIPVQIDEQYSNTMEYLAILFSTEFVMTIRNSKMARYRKSISTEDAIDILPDSSTAGIISSLLMGLSLDCLRKSSRLSNEVFSLEERRERDPEDVKIEEISAKRSELLTIESIVQGQLPIIETIISANRPAKIQESSLDYLRWASANLKSADRKLEWLERRVEVMRSLIDMYAQDRTNRRLGRLTVLSMIFMPITFLAGIWGMNFKSMPALDFQYGYLVALGTMLLIAGGMYLYFRRKGWFS